MDPGFHISHQLIVGTSGPRSPIKWQGSSLQGDRQAGSSRVLGVSAALALMQWKYQGGFTNQPEEVGLRVRKPPQTGGIQGTEPRA